ncbi:hypothetical protein PENSPDRAFT_146901 [Peniophora sp. CONT]|nr:hypothetical protein PENSPDRAFT_146901 [Peniophora sp. CONT]
MNRVCAQCTTESVVHRPRRSTNANLKRVERDLTRRAQQQAHFAFNLDDTLRTISFRIVPGASDHLRINDCAFTVLTTAKTRNDQITAPDLLSLLSEPSEDAGEANLSAEDAQCLVCADIVGDNTNAIVLCDAVTTTDGRKRYATFDIPVCGCQQPVMPCASGPLETKFSSEVFVDDLRFAASSPAKAGIGTPVAELAQSALRIDTLYRPS